MINVLMFSRSIYSLVYYFKPFLSYFFFYRAEAAALNETERATFAQFCQVLGRQLIPYMKRCLEAMFPSSVLSDMYGSSSVVADTTLDVNSLQLLLEPVMPQETVQESEQKPHHDDEAETKQEKVKEPTNVVLSDKSLPKDVKDESQEEINEKIPDTEQQNLYLT